MCFKRLTHSKGKAPQNQEIFEGDYCFFCYFFGLTRYKLSCTNPATMNPHLHCEMGFTPAWGGIIMIM
jgi:hypothetical protein